ncbi:hypothetical protein I5Q12_03710 [Serratia marcescens]|uniref:hypothetical protein n=1 Tax=Serratia TaxID=613 RepID=UPI0009A4DD04|nr:hypothetical protein [Serratia marcescens]MBH2723348.1 hypothetical protein [Serratia marcescens]MBH2814413.1 hypothetical protein [Serratia marcescens]MBH3275568.1 hypothetical protein [Serratia marcescens]MDK1707537.1 hypothetical protein [Serratia marcescens]OPJ97616.1 hypothetical protein B1H39_03705 [Serratia marcescens]
MISIDLIRYFLGVGGAAALGMLTLAYKDPAFYLSYIEKVITIIVGIIFFSACGAYAAASLLNDYISSTPNLTEELLKNISARFENGKNIALIIGVVAMFYFLFNIFCMDVAYRKKPGHE